MANEAQAWEIARIPLELRGHVLRLAAELAEGGELSARPIRLAASELGVEDGAPVAGDENGGQPSAFHAGRTGRVSMLERPATFAAGSTSGVEREGKMNQAMVEPL